MISVIVPVYNAERFIENTIESILIQDEATEIIVVDDGSSDQSRPMVEKLSKKDDRLKIYEHPGGVNRGRSATRNLGIKNATNEIVAFLDADDYYLPGRFEGHLDLLNQDNQIDGVYGLVGYLDWDTKSTIDYSNFRFKPKNLSIPADQLFYSIAPIGNDLLIHANALTLRKRVFDKSGYFDESLVVAEDVELWSRVSLKNRLTGVTPDRPLAVRIIHDENIFNKPDNYKNIRSKLLYRSFLAVLNRSSWKQKIMIINGIFMVIFRALNKLRIILI